MSLRSFATASLLFSASLYAAQVCDLTLTACPKQLPAGAIQVPLDVISLDARIPYCRETGVITSQVQPSIVFIIDNSGSMSMGDYADANENDPDEARFSVVADLLTEISASNPGTQVGMVAFSRRLQFDHRDNPLFQTAFPTDTSQHDSYVPLIPLNKIFPDGRTGLDTLRALLKHDTDGNMTYATTRPASRGNNDNLVQSTGGRLSMRPGTDITLGFEAAKLAMQTATAPKANQYFIFLSDGEPGGVDSGRTAMQNEFVQGVNTPTTFTVYFTRGNGQVPQSIRNMTTNIQANNYSATNPESAFFSVGTPATELQALLQSSVLSRILTVPTTAQGVVVSVNGATQSTTQRGADSNFVVSTRMPLNAGSTSIQFDYTHTFLDTTVKPAANRDTVIGYSLTVQRQANAALPANATKTCREQADVSLLSAGQPITTVTANQGNLEVRVTPTAGQACVNCTVEIKPSASTDKEVLNLTPAGASVSGSFVRLESLTPVPGDGVLQHRATDSLILVWVNPENPLDLVRRAYPFQSIDPTLGLFYDGKALDTVTAAHGKLEIRLNLPASVPCNACAVEVSLVGSADKENIVVSGSASPYKGSFSREVGISPVPGDGKLVHLATDSIVIRYTNTLTGQVVRRAYPYIDFQNEIQLAPHNTIAKNKETSSPLGGQHWLITDAPNLIVTTSSPTSACCEIAPGKLDFQNPDSANFVGMVIEASREFQVDMAIFTNLGQFVDKVSLTVTREQFMKLSPIAGKESRGMRLLWKGLTQSGSRAGTGAYIFRTSISLLPVPGITGTTQTTTLFKTLGWVRE